MAITFSSKEIISSSEEETQKIAQNLLKNLHDVHVIALFGDLGSGKTTFTNGIGKALGITRYLQSPTFTLVRQYNLSPDHPFKMLYHIDLYRLEQGADVSQIGLDEMLSDPKNLVLIEWAERIKETLPKDRIDIHFEYVDDTKRKISWKIQ